MNTERPKKMRERQEPKPGAIVARLIEAYIIDQSTRPKNEREWKLLAKHFENLHEYDLYQRAYKANIADIAEWDRLDSIRKQENLRTKIKERRRKRYKAYLMLCGLMSETIHLEDQNSIGRLIAVHLRELGSYTLDWHSQESIRTNTYVLEHIYPLQVDGEIIFHHLRLSQNGIVPKITYKMFLQYCRVFLQVAKTTSEENKALGLRGNESPQNVNVFITPEWAYKEAGIDVIFTPIKRIEHVAPKEVLEAFFGDRLKEFHKYSS